MLRNFSFHGGQCHTIQTGSIVELVLQNCGTAADELPNIEFEKGLNYKCVIAWCYYKLHGRSTNVILVSCYDYGIRLVVTPELRRRPDLTAFPQVQPSEIWACARKRIGIGTSVVTSDWTRPRAASHAMYRLSELHRLATSLFPFGMMEAKSKCQCN